MRSFLTFVWRMLHPAGNETPWLKVNQQDAISRARLARLDAYIKDGEPFYLKPNSPEDDAFWRITPEYRSQLERGEETA